jgi:hypothetical protein
MDKSNLLSIYRYTGVFPLEVKWLEHKPDLLPPSCAETKNTYLYFLTSPVV